MKRNYCISFISAILFTLIVNTITYADYSISIKLNFVDYFSHNFRMGGPWESVNMATVKSLVQSKVAADYNFGSYNFTVDTVSGDVDVDTTPGVITVKIGVEFPDSLFFGESYSHGNGTGFTSYCTPGAFCTVYSNNFGVYAAFQGAGATAERIATAIANTASHEAGHILGLHHAYAYDRFDPTISGAIDENTYLPVAPADLPGSITYLDTNYKNHLMVPADPDLISLEELATTNQSFSEISEFIIDFAKKGGKNVTINMVWGSLYSISWHQLQDIIVSSEKTLYLAGSPFTHYLDGKYLSGTVLKKSTIVPEITIEGKSGFYPSIKSALDNCSSGDEVSLLPATYTETDNVTVASGVTLETNSGATIKMADNKKVYVYGELDATSTTFTSSNASPSNGDWGGIYLYTGATEASEIESCTIEYANYGIYLHNNRSHIITSNTIENCGYGIYGDAGGQSFITGAAIDACNLAGIKLVSSTCPQIINTTVENTIYSGIYIDGSSPQMWNSNIFDNNQNGIYMTNWSVANLASASTRVNNRVYDNGSHEMLIDNSFPILGTSLYGTDDAQNEVTDDSGYLLYLTDGSEALAEMVWWGTAWPPSSLFFLENGTSLDRDPWASSGLDKAAGSEPASLSAFEAEGGC